MDSVAALVAAAAVDYARLTELREESNAASDSDSGTFSASDAEELAELEAAAGDCKDLDDAETRIGEDALSAEVRSGWVSGRTEMVAEEFRIVLCTGGPHVEIRGDIDHNGDPSSARLMYQDWGTPLTEYFGDNLDRDVLVQYASRFIMS